MYFFSILDFRHLAVMKEKIRGQDKIFVIWLANDIFVKWQKYFRQKAALPFYFHIQNSKQLYDSRHSTEEKKSVSSLSEREPLPGYSTLATKLSVVCRMHISFFTIRKIGYPT